MAFPIIPLITTAASMIAQHSAQARGKAKNKRDVARQRGYQLEDLLQDVLENNAERAGGDTTNAKVMSARKKIDRGAGDAYREIEEADQGTNYGAALGLLGQGGGLLSGLMSSGGGSGADMSSYTPQSAAAAISRYAPRELSQAPAMQPDQANYAGPDIVTPQLQEYLSGPEIAASEERNVMDGPYDAYGRSDFDAYGKRYNRMGKRV